MRLFRKNLSNSGYDRGRLPKVSRSFRKETISPAQNVVEFREPRTLSVFLVESSRMCNGPTLTLAFKRDFFVPRDIFFFFFEMYAYNRSFRTVSPFGATSAKFDCLSRVTFSLPETVILSSAAPLQRRTSSRRCKLYARLLLKEKILQAARPSFNRLFHVPQMPPLCAAAASAERHSGSSENLFPHRVSPDCSLNDENHCSYTDSRTK